MKNFILFISLFSLTATFKAQKNCVESSDPITNEKKTEYKKAYGDGTYVDNKGRFEMSVLYTTIKGKTTLTFPVMYSSAIQGKLPASTEVFFKLESGDILKLKTNSETVSQIKSGMSVATLFDYVFDLTKEEVSKLASSKVVLIRFPKLTSDGFWDVDESYSKFKWKSQYLMEGASCTLSHL